MYVCIFMLYEFVYARLRFTLWNRQYLVIINVSLLLFFCCQNSKFIVYSTFSFMDCSSCGQRPKRNRKTIKLFLLQHIFLVFLFRCCCFSKITEFLKLLGKHAAIVFIILVFVRGNICISIINPNFVILVSISGFFVNFCAYFLVFCNFVLYFFFLKPCNLHDPLRINFVLTQMWRHPKYPIGNSNLFSCCLRVTIFGVSRLQSSKNWKIIQKHNCCRLLMYL